ncbi:MAG: hypothetical protein DYG89_40335 [Caldilinea sp. CFX5]|nr:hypothetical protein [Caldilinea sp. CFX5]
MFNPPMWLMLKITGGLGLLLLLCFAPLQPMTEYTAAKSLQQTAPAVITITVQARPASRQDFRFHDDLGDFRLDSADVGDGDALTDTITFTVAAGVYTITEAVPLTWQLSQITCTPRAVARIDLRTGRASLTVADGDQLRCTFINERGVTVRTRSYQDTNGDRIHSLNEAYLSGATVTLYKDVNILIGSQATNGLGKANFNYLPPGQYTACAEAPRDWTNSQPGLVDTAYNAPCYTFTLNAGEMTTLWFGHQQPGDPAPTPQTPPTRVVQIAQGADVATDNSGYDGWTFVDDDLTQDDRGPRLYLPLASAR